MDSSEKKLLPSRSSKSPSLPPPPPPLESPENGESKTPLRRRKRGGWKVMPFILGNETLERLASFGLNSNFMVYLLREFHMDQVMASNVLTIWSGFTNFGPLAGAFISDSYLGKFTTIAYASIASFLGMLTLTLIAWLPQLHPPRCDVQVDQCAGPTKSQFTVLALALGLLSLGTAGVRPCSVPFGVDQFDPNTEKGKKGIDSFFSWYYGTYAVVLILALTVIVYIQDQVSWTLGFGIPTMLMFIAVVLFFVVMKWYVYVQPEGSVFTGIARVLVASYKKRKLDLPEGEGVDGVYYDYDSPLKGANVKKLHLTNQFRFFNKAALITGGDVRPDGSPSNPWRLCNIQKVEETKCLVRVIPIFLAGITCFVGVTQQSTFTVSQASKMDLHMGPNFHIPIGSLSVISFITIIIWLPIYSLVLVPFVRKFTRLKEGFTMLQRMGIGNVFFIISMVIAGFIERMRRASALSHGLPNGVAPLTVFWLAPQMIMMGFAEAFNFVALLEFYNKEFPENMASVGNSLFPCTIAIASYISAIVVNVVHNTTGRNGRPDWLTSDVNEGRVENLYFLVAGLGVLNLGYFLWVSRSYIYKTKYKIDGDDDVDEMNGLDVELNVPRPLRSPSKD